MLIQQEITQFNGFGQGNLPGKYFFSSGFKRTDNGVAPAWVIEAMSGNPTPSVLKNWIVEAFGEKWAVGTDGTLFKTSSGSWVQHATVANSHGNGLIHVGGRLFIAKDTHLDTYNNSSYTSNYKNFGLTVTDYRPMELYEDMILIGNRNRVAAFFLSDDSFTDNAFELPFGYNPRCIKAGKAGVLLGANVDNRGYLILWDGYSDRAIAPWIYLPTTISSITTDENGTWIVVTANGVFKTNGYTVEPYAKLPNSKANEAIFANVLPGGTVYHEGRLFISFNPPTSYTPTVKMPVGVLIHDSATDLWEFARASTNHLIKGEMGAMFLDSSLNINVAYSTTSPTAAQYVGQLKEAVASKAILITEELGQGNNPKYAEALIASLRFSPNRSTRYSSYNWTITVKIYDFKRPLYGWGLTNGASAALNQVKNDGSNTSQQGAQVGDEVTILNGANAGQIRHITAIANAGTNTEVWTLDSDLPNLTESGVYLQVMPFKKIGTAKTLSAVQDYFFNIKNRPKGKRYLVKLILETSDSNKMLPELTGLSFVYNDNPTQ